MFEILRIIFEPESPLSLRVPFIIAYILTLYLFAQIFTFFIVRFRRRNSEDNKKNHGGDAQDSQSKNRDIPLSKNSNERHPGHPGDQGGR
jgi:hypothetical protein